MFEVHDLADLLPVGCQKGQVGLPLPFDQGFANEDLARAGQIHLGIRNTTPAVDHQPVQGGALHALHLGVTSVPLRIQDLLAQQMRPHLLQPARLDVGDAATKETCGLDQLGAHHPASRFLAQLRSGVSVKTDAPRTQVALLIVLTPADVAQQARQHRAMQLVVAGRLGVQVPALLVDHGEQLRVHITPLAQTTRVDEMLSQQLFELAVRQLVGGRGRGIRGWPWAV